MRTKEQQIEKIDTEKMGIDLASTLEWHGFAILEVSIAALTDANFHRETKIINEMLEKLKDARLN